ncbi:transmembrane protein 231 isoform X3 [Syngnathoides biaculeatus]|uniref:transmembrane protein 231 isoform X3 n=1 Tax=Syngnathoides biaculeatus TaxID=300417 RepID=UPI002ADE7221|nr:transmembrane protein 231 isoform X3 [Syngnathoides biaculeatus]
MVFYEVYSHPALIRYKAGVCTSATVFLVVVACLTYVSPLLVAYRSQACEFRHPVGFWIKTNTYEEQAVIRFRYETLLVAATGLNGDYVAWSTFPHLNNLVGKNLRIPVVSVREEDQNQDGKLDRLNFQLQLPLKDEENVYSVQLLLTFSYQLFTKSTVVMQSLAYMQHSSSVPGAKLFVSGDLRLQQRTPLSHRGLFNIYNVSVIDGSSHFASAYDLEDIVRRYQERNLTTVLSCPMPVWTTGRAADSAFHLNAEIYYPLEVISYYPGFWETIKFAWIQYPWRSLIGLLWSARCWPDSSPADSRAGSSWFLWAYQGPVLVPWLIIVQFI